MAKMAMIGRSAGVLTGPLALMVVVILITFCADSSAATALPARVPQIWWGVNSAWLDHVIPTTPETVIEISIKKTWNSSLLRIDFSGGDLVCQTPPDGILPEVTFGICVDDVTRAESINKLGYATFQRYCPAISTSLGTVSAGAHKISVVVAHTVSPGDSLHGTAYYTTRSPGQQFDSRRGQLIVEEWPTWGPKPAAAE